ncbi:lipid II flippase MurJ [Streptomyces sp. 7N604]|uniref:lipid II flippase MurJ n=1 Tax=Streptomyces sp. 7N604 TaxID=3457415 RepID=UPI003FD5AD8E
MSDAPTVPQSTTGRPPETVAGPAKSATAGPTTGAEPNSTTGSGSGSTSGVGSGAPQRGGPERFIARAAAVTAVLTAAGALLGLVRDQLVAHLFGADGETDAFLVAWTVPEIAATLLIEDAMALVMIPAFSLALSRRASAGTSAHAGADSGDDADRDADRGVGVGRDAGPDVGRDLGPDPVGRLVASTAPRLFLALACCAGLLAAAAPRVVRLLAPGLADPALAVDCTRLTAVTVLTFGIAGYFSAALRAHRRFLPPAAIYVAYNVGIIATVLAVHGLWGVRAAAAGVAVGSALMVLVQLPAFLRRLPGRQRRGRATKPAATKPCASRAADAPALGNLATAADVSGAADDQDARFGTGTQQARRPATGSGVAEGSGAAGLRIPDGPRLNRRCRADDGPRAVDGGPPVGGSGVAEGSGAESSRIPGGFRPADGPRVDDQSCAADSAGTPDRGSRGDDRSGTGDGGPPVGGSGVAEGPGAESSRIPGRSRPADGPCAHDRSCAADGTTGVDDRSRAGDGVRPAGGSRVAGRAHRDDGLRPAGRARAAVGPRSARPAGAPAGLAVLAVLAPVALFALARQAQVLVERYLGSSLPAGAISHLNYAQKVAQVPMTLSLMVVTVTFPLVARAMADGEKERARRRVERDLTVAGLLVLVGAAYVIAYAPQLIELLFQRGAFNAQDTAATASVMRVYALGLLGHSLTGALIRPFFSAARPTWDPAAAMSVGLLITIVAAKAAIAHWGVHGIAAANAAGITVTALLLLRGLGKQGIAVDVRRVTAGLARLALAAGAAVAAGWAAAPLVPSTPGTAAAGCLIVPAAFAAAAFAVRAPEVPLLLPPLISSAKRKLL